MAVGAGVGRIEQFHGAQVDLAGLHGYGYALFHGQARNKEDGQCLVTEGGDGRVLMAKNGGVIGVGGNAFETVQQGLFQRADIDITVKILDQFQSCALGDEISHRSHRDKGGRGFIEIGLTAGNCHLGLHRLA